MDLFVDPICPYCRVFEQNSGGLLFTKAAAGEITLRVHPLAILNRLSQGSNYSTRASAMFAAVAAESPEKAEEFLHELYEQQPAENTTGLTNQQLREIASSIGAPAVSDEDVARYETWVDAHTQLAVTGPLPATDDITLIAHVPTVIVDGSVFIGDSDETDVFAAFLQHIISSDRSEN